MLPGSKIRLAETLRANPWIAENADEPRIHETKDNAELRGILAKRCETGDCAVLGDIALAKQSMPGLWLALKRDGEEWHGFESIQAGRMAADDPERFDALIDSMRTASAEQCRRLQYRPLSERAEMARMAEGAEDRAIEIPSIGEER